MKKFLSILALALLSLQVTGQAKQFDKGNSLVMFNTSYNIPIICYGSHDVNNPNAAFAKKEMGLDINYGYLVTHHFGFVVSVGYGWNKVDKRYITSPSSKGFTYFTIYAGPQYVMKMANGLYADIRFMAGTSWAQSPTLIYKDERLLSEANTWAFSFSTGMGLKYLISPSTFVSLRMDHFQMKPHFNVPGDKKNEQHIVLLSPGLGLGVKL